MSCKISPFDLAMFVLVGRNQVNIEETISGIWFYVSDGFSPELITFEIMYSFQNWFDKAILNLIKQM